MYPFNSSGLQLQYELDDAVNHLGKIHYQWILYGSKNGWAGDDTHWTPLERAEDRVMGEWMANNIQCLNAYATIAHHLKTFHSEECYCLKRYTPVSVNKRPSNEIDKWITEFIESSDTN